MLPTQLPTFSKRLILFAGAYGSGKTEVAVNYAIQLAEQLKDQVSIIDLDIVNPYFRSREAAAEMAAHGVNVIMPPGEQSHADLPIILPEIKGAIEQTGGKVIIDVGGDDLGARVLSSLADVFLPGSYEFLLVLNANRPFTSTVEGTVKMIREIETSSRLSFTGIVSNTHLIGETTAQTILDGYLLATSVSKATSLPLVFVSAMEDVVAKLDEKSIAAPVVTLSRRMLKPWEDARDTGSRSQVARLTAAAKSKGKA